VGQLPLFIPIRLLIEKPAVVFIGEARENQLPISLSCKFVSIRGQTPPLHPNSTLNRKTRLDVGSATPKQQTALILFS